MTDAIRLIVDNLNKPPFNESLTIITYDALRGQRLLQILSDVVSWISDSERMDIKSEAAEDTAMRLFNHLRVLRFRPPSDIEQLDEWRAGIVEGSPAAVNPVLAYLFSNVEPLKERAYLARFLVRVEIPGEVQDMETTQLQQDIQQLMQQFKETHQRVTDLRGDSMMLDDIKTDLRSMEQEKEQLGRKIDKVQRRVRNLPNLDRIVSFAAQHRRESERVETMHHQRTELRNSIMHAEQKSQRLSAQLAELHKQGANIDPTHLVAELEDEIESNTYILHTQLAREVDQARQLVSELQRVADTPAIDADDVQKMQQQIDARSSRIMQLEQDRDKNEENYDENFSIYRHQAAAVERKKAAVANKLHEARLELKAIEKQVEDKRAEMSSENGGEDLVTETQFQRQVALTRQKKLVYTKRNSEIEEMKREVQVLARTSQLLSQQWNTLRERIEDMGGEVVESIAVPSMARPKTSKPRTDDVDELREKISSLNVELDALRDHVLPIQKNYDKHQKEFNELMEEFSTKKRDYEVKAAAAESGYARLQEEVQQLEARFRGAKADSIETATNLSMANAQWEKLSRDDGAAWVAELQDHVKSLEDEAEALQRSDNGAPSDMAHARRQYELWRGILTLYQHKIQLTQAKAAEGPIGDR